MITVSAASPRLFTPEFGLLCFTSCLNFAVHILAVTSLPLLVTGPIHGTEADVGLALSAFYVAAVVLRVPLGRLIDAWGRRVVMILCLALLVVASGGYYLAGGMVALFAVRALHGACFAGYGTAGSTMVGDIVPAHRRGEALGYYGLLGHVALAVTPWIAFQTIQHSGFGALYLLAGVLAGLGVVGSLLLREPPRLAGGTSSARLILGLFHPAAFRPAVILCLFTMVYAAQILFLPLYASVRGVGDPGLYFAVYGGILMLVRGPAGTISDRIGRGPAIIPGLLLSVVSMLLLAAADALPLMLISAGVFATAFALVTPSLNALVVDITQPSERGSAMATHTTFFDIGTGLGAALCGFLAHNIGFPATYAAGSSLGLIAVGAYAALVAGRTSRPRDARRWHLWLATVSRYTSRPGSDIMADSSIQEGAPAPDFSLPSTSGETISLSDFRGKQEVVLYFYPKDSTPGCTVEACSFRDNLPDIQQLGAVVLGVSGDSVKSHATFTQKQSLNFPLLADTEKELAQKYGVWVEKKQYGRTFMGIERSTFLIGKDGTIKKIWRKVSPKSHVADVLNELKGQ